ncbi:MAG: DUF5706 domain-containing protein [Candidatus Wallbacteria bacterium]|nr:DUF5706 domain-containing protein [Candidatus Wallbacteria bacterium]
MNCPDAPLRETIFRIFLNLQDMVKYAEAKNSAVAASAGAIVLLIYQKLGFTTWPQLLFSTGYCLIVLALVLSFWSFFPVINNPPSLKSAPGTDSRERNLFLFSEIASFPEFASFEQAIVKKYYGSEALSPLDRDILIGVYANACIAHKKFRFFRYALLLFLSGILLLVISGPLL